VESFVEEEEVWGKNWRGERRRVAAVDVVDKDGGRDFTLVDDELDDSRDLLCVGGNGGAAGRGVM